MKRRMIHNGMDYHVGAEGSDIILTNVNDTDDMMIIVGGVKDLKGLKPAGRNITYESWISDELLGYAFDHVDEAQILKDN